MFCCYILYSDTLGKYYIGSTSDLDGRLRRHLSNHKGYTGTKTDWQIKWAQIYETKKEALNVEKLIKAWKSRVKIEELIARGKL